MSSLWFLFFIPAAIAAGWGLMILFKPGEAVAAQKLLAGSLLSGGVAIVLYSLGFRPGAEYVHWDDISFYVIMMVVIPLYYLAIRHLTTLGGIQVRDYLVFLAPAIVVSFGVLSLYLFHYEHGYLFSRIFIGFYTVAVIIWSYDAGRKYYHLLSEYCSTVENTSVDDIRMLTITGMTIIPIATTIIAVSHYQRTVVLTTVMIVILSIFLFIAGLFLYRIRYSAEALRQRLAQYDAMEKASEPKPDLSAESSYARFLQQLEQVIVEEKMFLDPDISLVSLAERIKTNRTYLSDAIHLTYGMSFSDYINHLRVQHSISLMREKKKAGEPILVKDIAQESGYSISSSFYRAFVKEMGVTPKQWIKTL